MSYLSAISENVVITCYLFDSKYLLLLKNLILVLFQDALKRTQPEFYELRQTFPIEPHPYLALWGNLTMKALTANFLVIRWPYCDLATSTLLICFITGISKARAASFHQAHLFLTLLISRCLFHPVHLLFISHECLCF